MAYTNADGLVIRFGTERGESADVSEAMIANERMISVKIGPTSQAAAGVAGRMDIPNIPAGAYITRGFLMVNEGFTTGNSATLTIGLCDDDGNAIDADGIDATIAGTAIDVAGDVVKCDGALCGGLLKVLSKGWVYTTVDTGTFSTGDADLILYYIEV